MRRIPSSSRSERTEKVIRMLESLDRLDCTQTLTESLCPGGKT